MGIVRLASIVSAGRQDGEQMALTREMLMDFRNLAHLKNNPEEPKGRQDIV
jgi:hypothetical protein